MRHRNRTTLRRLGLPWVLAAVVLGVTGGAVYGQADATFLGGAIGLADNTQQWRPPQDAEGVRGLILGAFADVRTPIDWLRVRAEGAYTQRGGDVVLDSGGEPVQGGVRTDYLAFGLHLMLAHSFGPVRAHVAGGPTIDQVIASTLDPVLGQVLQEESGTVFAVSIGGGLGGWVTDRVFLGADVRLTEGLGDAYTGNFAHFKNRTVEARLNVGVPVGGLTGG